jgi:hypothetical protein
LAAKLMRANRPFMPLRLASTGVYALVFTRSRSRYIGVPSGVNTFATFTYLMLAGLLVSGPTPPRLDHTSCE